MPPVQRAACLLVPDTTYQTRHPSSPVRICVIDLGTNSFHAVIVDAYPNGSYKVVDRMKEMVRLGQSGLSANRLPEDAMERGLQALRRIHTLATGWDAREFLAYATSAIREARNGGDFIEQVKREVGLRIRPISGAQEAELIFLGVRRAVDMHEPSLIVDIGGGSVEFIVYDGREVSFAQSYKLGAARMTERFVSTDPLSSDDVSALREHYRSVLEPVFDAARAAGVTSLVGSSGTAKSLARVCAGAHGDEDRTVFQQTLEVDAYRDALRWVVESNEQDRIDHPSIDPKRVDQIGAGALLLDVLVEGMPDVRQIKTSANALREGMVDHFIQQNYARIRKLAPFTDVRRRSVHEIAFRFEWEERHAQHVAATATFLFDALIDRYGGPATDVELLEYAALLHDIGYHISHSRHHKHSRYLIQHADLQGFQPDEKKILALTARYHRKAFPNADRHKRYRKLSERNRSRVRQLASILRIAEGLDRSHFQNVIALEVDVDDTALTIAVDAQGDPELELWSADREADLFREVYGMEVSIAEKEMLIEGDGIQMGPAPVTHAVPAPGNGESKSAE
ncbi:Ppx/GppA phosphatase family protein [Longibacter sp.]|jgi:exopolyphosphatase/guanosine-5'-triphosphate,3'-diphosphate pyrophosphatase|uniref:Ppx/GppA phosphatase family protein n=1 Tax=Longibacter sp. TaxID=2045415 RepID=UPI003EC00561